MKEGNGSAGARIRCVAATLVALMLAVSISQAVAGSSKGHWFQANLARGEIEGYRWAVGAKGPKHEPLGQICAQISIVEPPRDDFPEVEGRDTTDCGQLRLATDVVSSTNSLESGKSGVSVLEAIYRPVVRKVRIVFASGEQELYRTSAPQLSNRVGRGIPKFRYVVAQFLAESCVRRITGFDGNGKTVSNRASPPCSA